MAYILNNPDIGFVKGLLYLNFTKQTIDQYLKLNGFKDIPGKENQTKRDGDGYHITIIDPYEMKTLKQTNIIQLIDKLNIRKALDLMMIGLGKASDGSDSCTFIVCISNVLQTLRKELGLPVKDLHITLGFIVSDVHNVRKNLDRIYQYNPDIIKKHMNQIIISSLYDQKEITSNQDIIETNKFLYWCLNDPQIFKILDFAKINQIILDQCLVLIDKTKYNTDLHKKISHILSNAGYLIGVYYASKYSQTASNIQQTYDEFVKNVMTNKLKVRNGSDTETIKHVLKVLNFPIIQNVKWLYELNCDRSRTYKYYDYDEIKKIFVSIESPRNFSFVIDKLAGSSLVETAEHIELFAKLGITHIITLMENPLSIELQKIIKDNNISYNYMHVDDREPMTNTQMNQIVQIIDSSKKTLVHCLGGVGRTATALVGYLITQGNDREMSLRALDKRRTILSTSQEAFLKEWKNKQIRIQSEALTKEPVPVEQIPVESVPVESASIDETKKEKKIQAKIKLPGVIMMVGLPASGKTTFAKIVHEQIQGIERVNQDEMRGKGQCEDLFSKYSKQKSTTTILDRCNPTKKERKYWLELNLSANKDVWCIFFDSNPEECRWRIKHRTDHPTVQAHQGPRIVDAVAEILEEPTMDEGFTRIERITSFKEANQLLLLLGCDIKSLSEDNHDHIIKFVRTKHLFNLGGATRDDLILGPDDVKTFLNTDIYIEEKIDGANMGFSIKDYKVVAQNRSHYVNSAYHAQFKLLDKWILDHTEDLYNILGDGNLILYGEWVFALHSINYVELPDYFIAFDLYDISEQRFYSRDRLEKILEGTTISLIPCIKKGSFKNITDIVDLVKTKSQFYDGPIEGVYVRRCNELWLEDRAKIVRNDFLPGENFKHWTKNQLTVNKIKSKY
jgi:gluconate kinase